CFEIKLYRVARKKRYLLFAVEPNTVGRTREDFPSSSEGERSGKSPKRDFAPWTPEPKNVGRRLGVGKAALKSPALQTLRANVAAPYRASASGVRAASAPLLISRESN